MRVVKGVSLVIDLVTVALGVLSVTTRVSPSSPGIAAMTLANGHLHGGNLSSVMSTNEPTCMVLMDDAILRQLAVVADTVLTIATSIAVLVAV